MLIRESTLRLLTRKIMNELFTRKSGIGLGKFFKSDQDINPFDYGDEGMAADNDYYGEADEKLEEEEIEEKEEKVDE